MNHPITQQDIREMDANALFVVSAISRTGVAENLNNQLGRIEFTATDARLTDQFCTRYAAALGEIDSLDAHQEAKYELETELHEKCFAEFGVEPSDDE